MDTILKQSGSWINLIEIGPILVGSFRLIAAGNFFHKCGSCSLILKATLIIMKYAFIFFSSHSSLYCGEIET